MPRWGALLRVAQRILRNREDAEDAVQNALLDAFRNLNRFQGRSRFSSRLTRIAMNAALMRLRVSRRQPAILLDEVPESGEAQARIHPMETRPNPEEEYLSKEGRVLLQKAPEKLSPVYVEVLHLLGAQELSANEAAGLLEVPVGTVKAWLHRARAKLTRQVRSITSRKQQLGAMSRRHRAMRKYGQYHRPIDSLSTFWLNRSCPQRLGKSRWQHWRRSI